MCLRVKLSGWVWSVTLPTGGHVSRPWGFDPPPPIVFCISVIIIHVQLMAVPSLSNLVTSNLALLADWSCARPISASPFR